MQTWILFLTLIVLTVIGYYMGRSRAVTGVTGHTRTLHSLPSYHGFYVALWCGLPALGVTVLWLVFEPVIVEALLVAALPEASQNLTDSRLELLINDIRNLAGGSAISGEANPELVKAAGNYSTMRLTGGAAMVVVGVCVAIAGIAHGRRKVAPQMRARNQVERVTMVFLVVSSTIAILTTIGIVLSLLFESMRFFAMVPITEFLFGLQWSPQTALRADQVGSSGAFGAVPLLVGTILISLIAMCVAAPVGLFSAIYLSEYARQSVRATAKPLLEVLAGVPTVVYGFFAALTVAPFFRGLGAFMGLDVSSESALAAGVVMGIMVIPFVSSLSDDVINAVPQTMRDGSFALGATHSETIRKVVVPAALPGIIGGLLLATSRAIGETMIVVMAAGLSANLTANPLEAVTTVTVQIVTLLVGDQEFDSPKTLAAFALGLMLFCVTLVLNVIALTVVNKYREQYE